MTSMQRRLPVQVATKPIVGWRTWTLRPSRIADPGTGPVLVGATGLVWPGPVMNAVCRFPADSVLRHAIGGFGSLGRHDQPAPWPDCQCGIHAWKPGHRGDQPPTHAVTVTGQVALDRVVIEGGRGYRASHATMLAPLAVDLRCTQPSCADAPTHVVGLPDGYSMSCPNHSNQPSRAIDVWLDDTIAALERRYVAPIVPMIRGEETP